MKIIEWEKDESVAVVTMNNGENRHNPDFIDAMLGTLDEIEKCEDISAVVITSSDKKCWSLGIDLEWIMPAMEKKEHDAIRKFLYGLDNIFIRILSFPMPVIAAINGHAFGDGTLLACACDFRYMKSNRGYFCYPEVDISIPFLPGMLEIVRKAIPYYELEEIIFSGRKTKAPELEESHVIRKACADDVELMKEVMLFAKSFCKKRPIFGEIKKRLHKGIIDAIKNENPEYIEPLKLTV